jgi:hypothetical protein
MKHHKKITLLFFLIFISTVAFTQHLNWDEFFPGVQPDSILLLSTNKQSAKLHEETFPLADFSSYMNLYELKKHIQDKKEIESIVKLFPRDTCTTYPHSRCLPNFRDCVVFYKKGKPCSAMKICFECEAVVSTPATDNARCLADEKYLQPIREKWIAVGMYDLFKR